MKKFIIFCAQFFFLSLVVLFFVSFSDLSWAGDFILDWPVSGRIITDYHAVYINPVTGAKQTHSGIDIEADPGTEVKAAADGTVAFVGYTPAGGSDSSVKNTVSIDHPNGLRTTYLQVCEVYVSRGQGVTRGQAIAKVAAVGDLSSSLSHLHFGLKQGTVYLDPKAYLRTVAEDNDVRNENPVDSGEPLFADPIPPPLAVLENEPVLTAPQNPAPGNAVSSPDPGVVGAINPMVSETAMITVPADKATVSEIVSPVASDPAVQAFPSFQALYLSSSAAEEKELTASTSLSRGGRSNGVFRLPSSSMLVAIILAAVLLALVQTFYPVFLSEPHHTVENRGVFDKFT